MNLKDKNNMDWNDIKISSNLKPELSENSKIVMEKRYLAKNDKGEVIESPEDLFKRVAKFIASADFIYSKSEEEVNETANRFYDLMASFQFLPNSPTLMNAGRSLGHDH